MHLAAYLSLLICLFVSLGCAGFCLVAAWRGEVASPLFKWVERGQTAVTWLISLASLILLWALVGRDFSFSYVGEYTDRVLPLFYAVTAFWAGQAGSILFWAWMVAIFGFFFMHGPGYQAVSGTGRTWFWLFYMAVQAFFLLILTGYSNPFLQVVPAPPDGTGLNPLLQNPGMIFHPPLLFLGYAGFTPPACLALAAMAGGVEADRRGWLPASHNYSRMSWLFLSAGIILGAWWSYNELGWGGYWAWDPVENASLVPWLSATAFMHTAIVESRRGALRRTNVFLVLLTLLLCFFGTWIVRSGVIDSLHAFGGGGVGPQILLFIILGLAIGLVAVLGLPGPSVRTLSSMTSRQGFLVLAAWIFLALGLVVILGTMWPVVSKAWSANPVGLDARFYNRVCLPLFTLLAVILAVCPWLGWIDGVRRKDGLWIVLGSLAVLAIGLYAVGVRIPLATLSAAAGGAVLLSITALFALVPEMRRSRYSYGAYAIHAGVALMVIGVAFSGPYQQTREAIVPPGQSVSIGEYTFVFRDIAEGNSPAMAFIEARVAVTKAGRELGVLTPQRRMYRNFPQPFAEVSTLPGLGDELYATLVSVTPDGAASLKISVNPLINWIWIGGTILCLAPLLCLQRFRGRSGQASDSSQPSSVSKAGA